jgi:hypothetical protein
VAEELSHRCDGDETVFDALCLQCAQQGRGARAEANRKESKAFTQS